MQHKSLAALFACVLLQTTAIAKHLYSPHIPTQPAYHQAPNHHLINIHVNASHYTRSAYNGFSNHSFTTTPLSTTYFGKDTFRLSNIFENCIAPLNTQNYNPYVRILKIQPRVTYDENGAMLGATFYTQLKGSKFRVGARINTPFIHRKVTRHDQGSRDTAPTQDVMSEQAIKINEVGGGVNDYRLDRAKIYRLDFIEALPKNTDYQSALSFGSNDTIALFDQTLHASAGVIGGALIVSPESTVPRGENVGVSETVSGKTALPATLDNLRQGTVYQVIEDINYATIADTATKPVATRIADQDTKATIWFTPTFDDIDDLTLNPKTTSIQNSMTDAIKDFNSNHYEWLNDRNYTFESTQETGLGDTTAELFLSYDGIENSTFDASVGLILPSSNGKTKASNPYATNLGYLGHSGMFAGVQLIWNPRKSICTFSAYGKYNILFPNNEQRNAMPTGAQVTNIGPEAMVKTSWNFANMGAWLDITHPKTTSFVYGIGYDFYYKTADTLTFLQDKYAGWLGNYYNTATRTFSTPNNFIPSVETTTMNTERIAHTVSLRAHYCLSEWIRIHTSGSLTVAGKNHPRILELSVGCIVAF